ncbi:hypothetical protein ACM44_07540 [Chryseobacterium koreense CCUG 49689]|uniref:Uncharacterized protein n=1 Tax=Chryseobacterium koreense CCUG 49689 TaxID=1304281 RepID=A0A0J7LQC2_9FLAO|nr:hypothetical protein ACM44_07540 [Chryseobacterium koreense CCUG 49689]
MATNSQKNHFELLQKLGQFFLNLVANPKRLFNLKIQIQKMIGISWCNMFCIKENYLHPLFIRNFKPEIYLSADRL